MSITLQHLRRLAQIAAAALCVTTGALGQQAWKGQVFLDHTHGYKIQVPSGWVQMPVHIDETQVLAWFETEKSLKGDTEKGDTGLHKHASLRVIRLEKPWDGEGRNPGRRRDYADYQRRRLSSKWKFTKATETHDSTPIVKWEGQISGEDIDRGHILTWVYPGSDHDYAVQFYGLEEHFPRQRPSITNALQSFRFISRTKETKAIAAKRKPFALRDWIKKPILERQQERSAIEARHEAKVLAKLPPGWTSHQDEYFLVLSHTDSKTTRRVRDTVHAFGKWLRERFGPLSDLTPMRATVRICKNSREYDAYRRGGWRADYNFNNREVVMCNDRFHLNMKDVFWRIYHRYMLDVAPDVFFNSPEWLKSGLYSYFASARLKGRSRTKLEFVLGFNERQLYISLRRSKTPAQTMRELLTLDTGVMDDSMQLSMGMQATTLIRFLEGPGTRYKSTGKSFLCDYMRTIGELAAEADAADKRVLVWDTEEAILQIMEADRSGDEKVRVPLLDSRWTHYLEIVQERRKRFTKTLQKTACDWPKSASTTVERAFARFHSDY